MRAAPTALGVDIIQNCEVTGIRRDVQGAVEGVETTRGAIKASKVGVVAAGHTSRADGDGRRAHADRELSAAGAGVRADQAGDAVRGDVEHHPRLHLAVRQGRAGDRRRAPTSTRPTARPAGCTSPRTRWRRSAELFPTFRRLRMLRNWGGIVDVTPDRSPIIGTTPVPGLFVNCGWGTGGFKATPGSGHVLRRHDRQGRAASDRGAVHARPVQHRPADRRSRGRGGGALKETHAADPLSLLRHGAPRDRVPPCGRGACAVRPIPSQLDDEAWAEFLYIRSNPKGAARRALAARARLRTLLQCAARHGERPASW